MGLLDYFRDPEERRLLGRNLLDVGNRGIAGLLGGPADIANLGANALRAGYGFAGHKLGLLDAGQMPGLEEKPMFGSEWIGDKMQQAGMVSDYRNPAAELIAGGVLMPAGAAALSARGPQIAAGLNQMAANAAVPRQLGTQRGVVIGDYVDVFHGTRTPFNVDDFNPALAGSRSAHKSADVPLMWTTRSPEVADMFTATRTVDATPLARYGPRGAGVGAIRNLGFDEGAATMPLKAKLNNPLVISGSNAEKMIFGSGDFREGGSSFAEFIKNAKNAGHDGVIIKANPRGSLEFRAEQYLLFDPKTQAISKIGGI